MLKEEVFVRRRNGTYKHQQAAAYILMMNKLLSEGTIQKLRHNEPISWKNINELCKLLEIQPGDLLEYYDDFDE